MSKSTPSLTEEVIDVCLRRGIIYPSADIYGSMSGSFCYAPVGEMIRQNLISLWRHKFVVSEENIYQISGATILPSKVFEASGHVDTFNDPLLQCTGKCKSMYRIDHLIMESLGINVDGKSIEEMMKLISDNKINCSKCGGEVADPKQFNLMFKTKVGPTSEKIAFLRPETAKNIFINFKRRQHAMRGSLLFGVSQVGKAYRNEISPRNFLIRLREFDQM